jgi:putative membrane protein
MKIIIRWAITAVAIFLTAWLVPGFNIEGSNGFIAVIAAALVLGLVNAIIRPILVFLSCGCVVATLGLFMLVINALTLLLTSWICRSLGIGFYINGFWPALWGSIIISIISFVLSMILIDDREHGK